MRFAGVLLFALLSTSHAESAKKEQSSTSSKESKAKSIKPWIDFAMSKGRAAPLTYPLAGKLGYERGLESRRLTNYDKKTNRNLIVAVRLVKGKEYPIDAVGSVGKYYEVDGRQHFDGYFFRWSFEGKLLAAVNTKGPRGAIVQSELDISSPDVKKMSATELDYYLKNSPRKVEK